MRFIWLLLLPFLVHATDLSVEEKVGQLLLVHFNGKEYNAKAEKLLRQAHVGGFIYYEWANGLVSPSQVKTLSEKLQKNSKVPLFIAVDQEGGRVTRLKEGFTHPPGQPEISRKKKPETARIWATRVGKELNQVGINLNLAPVSDIATDPKKSPLRNRSYGSTPSLVTTFTKAAIHGYLGEGIIPTLKHFPGLGDTSVDTHQKMAINDKNKEELLAWELVPYRKLSHLAPAIMTAHVMVPALDPNNPATLSRPIITDLLRNQLGYNGIVMTDSLVMEGLNSDVDEAAIKALEAGHDIVLLGGKQLVGEKNGYELQVDDVIRIHRKIVQAVKEGRLNIDASVGRILALKNQMDLSARIWKNESNQSYEGLTAWNNGENFASLGIGHFIWYPKERGPFDETFPSLIVYLESKGVEIPAWMKKEAPWDDQEEFKAAFNSVQMVELRELLYTTRLLQAQFIVERLEAAIPKMALGLHPKERKKLETSFQRLQEDSRGLFAMIDYHNFKGAGTSVKERYKGQGWGLRQVLLGMSEDLPAMEAFKTSAKSVLTKRAKNAPAHRNEVQWLAGWNNRINRY